MTSTTYNSDKKIWSGRNCPPIYNPKSNLGEIILTVLDRTPTRITQISADTGAEVTCFEMKSRIIKIANYFKKLNFQIGDVISVLASNNEYVTPLVFAGYTMGLQVHFLSPKFIESDIIYMLEFTKSKMIFCDSNFIEIIQRSVDRMQSNHKIVTMLEKLENYENLEEIVRNSDFDENFICPDIGDPEKVIAGLVCTSGTTGPPKLVGISHSQYICHMRPFWLPNYGKNDVLFTWQNCYWTIGPMFMIIGTLYCDKRIMTKSEFDSDLFLDIIEKYKVTTSIMPGNILLDMAKCKSLRPLPSVKTFLVGGSKMPPNLIKVVEKYFPNGIISNCYGASENGGSAISTSIGRHDTVGYLVNGMQVKIIDENGNRLGPNQKGEICCKGPVPNLGYINNPEATKLAVDDDGFLHTGDIGYFDNENFLFVVDRIKDIIKNDGFQTTPGVIENLINELELVENSCVVGVYDNFRHDIICAFVKRSNDELTENDVINHVNGQVAEFKKIKGGVYFVESFPLTLSGKIIRPMLREIASENLKKTKSHLFHND